MFNLSDLLWLWSVHHCQSILVHCRTTLNRTHFAELARRGSILAVKPIVTYTQLARPLYSEKGRGPCMCGNGKQKRKGGALKCPMSTCPALRRFDLGGINRRGFACHRVNSGGEKENEGVPC